ncbi:MAG: hypothetical protein Q8R30_01900 [bacterium]|nr:hypothetical protein [bacterium]MDZ4286257.1 hypothetical protein [Candidatus Sungbacteria bacterium]
MISPVIAKAEEAVEKLLVQYREYQSVQLHIEKLKKEQLEMAVDLSKQQGEKISAILSKKSSYPTLQALAECQIEEEKRLQAISDAMMFADPIVWMMYKYKAYLETPSAIRTVKDLKKHCAKDDYICTKRFMFLNEYVKRNSGIDITDVNCFPDDMPLPELYGQEFVVALVKNKEFLRLWETQEYYKEGERVAKWENILEPV